MRSQFFVQCVWSSGWWTISPRSPRMFGSALVSLPSRENLSLRFWKWHKIYVYASYCESSVTSRRKMGWFWRYIHNCTLGHNLEVCYLIHAHSEGSTEASGPHFCIFDPDPHIFPLAPQWLWMKNLCWRKGRGKRDFHEHLTLWDKLVLTWTRCKLWPESPLPVPHNFHSSPGLK